MASQVFDRRTVDVEGLGTLTVTIKHGVTHDGTATPWQLVGIEDEIELSETDRLAVRRAVRALPF
ncbi:hypothetical protein Q9S78_11910 [Microbacterium sp. KSW-18]|uniref:Uncharacterized protein n=1 Tax=Microbacterium aquilitoris TaxID=3067307 RepID=A0ABU3GKZ8_9MICO|nr:hypothetical protein [Microbacterium sp. KSW-18]MDT3331374.1 hypothetical protein [Microbacterium sp. KSW-18]